MVSIRTPCTWPSRPRPSIRHRHRHRHRAGQADPGRLLERGPGPQRGVARMAAFQVIVDQTHGLHEGIQRGRSDKAPATPLEVLGQRGRGGGAGHGADCRKRDARGPAGGLWFMAPEVGRQRAKLVAQHPSALRVVDDGSDLARVAHDARVAQQTRHVGGVEGGQPIHVELAKGAPEGLALVQDGQPAQAGLEAFEADLLEQAPVIGHRKAPLVIMVVLVGGRGLAPRAAHRMRVAGEQTVGQGGGCGHAPLFRTHAVVCWRRFTAACRQWPPHPAAPPCHSRRSQTASRAGATRWCSVTAAPA